jgi:mRNA interferase MazF
VVEELGGSTSEVIRKAIHLAWFTTMQDRMRRESAEIATNFIGSVVTVAPTSTSARPSLTRPEAEIDGRKCRILLEQMLGVDISKLNNWIGVLDDDEMDALDDALRLYHGLL